jgi:hypothetical protein
MADFNFSGQVARLPMKHSMITLAVVVGLFPIFGHAEPIKVTFEWVELDRTQCADLAKPFANAAVTESDHKKFADLKNSGHGRVLVKHVQQIEPGSKGDHTTQIGETKLDLQLAVGQREAGFYEVAVEALLEEEAESIDSLKPANSAATQLKTIPMKQFSTTIKLSHGKSFSLSGLSQRKNDHEITQILIVSIVEPWKTTHVVGRGADFDTGVVSPPQSLLIHPEARLSLTEDSRLGQTSYKGANSKIKD